MPVYNAPIASLSTLTPQQQENLILMADTDVRSILQNLEAIAALQVIQAASIAINAAGLTGLKTITVVEKTAQLDRASFVFAAGFWNINVFHELQNRYPITAIFDASGDEQFIQFVGKDVNNGTVELTQSQYDSNSFPLKIVLHSRVADAAANALPNAFKRHPGSAMYYKVFEDQFYSSSDGITGILQYILTLPVEIYMAVATPDLFVYSDGNYFREPIGTTGGPWIPITPSEFNNAKIASGTIRL